MTRAKKTLPSYEPRGAVLGEMPQAALEYSEAVVQSKLRVSAPNHRVRVTLGPGGRMVIPAALREAMQVQEGDALLAWVEDGELHVISPSVGARQAQALLQGLLPKHISLADELIGDRRREADERD